MEAGRGDVAAGTWIVRGGGDSRDGQTSAPRWVHDRVAVAAAHRQFRPVRRHGDRVDAVRALHGGRFFKVVLRRLLLFEIVDALFNGIVLVVPLRAPFRRHGREVPAPTELGETKIGPADFCSAGMLVLSS